ncbi:SRPBCC family protein [Motilibacter deserti]|uniref:Uncharacterized protein n=1 Tax=Motilibacter deserti TaxID=2714956 RepID=A0ABX0GXZ2_9ACTN|nr:hypothetical protein [Motilibacter deserti]NHC14459.1 hypothetical protein [Motilibacter deserti]
MSVEISTWSIERDHPHPPERVFTASADPKVKVRWFDLSDAADPDYSADYRIGGRERFRSPRAMPVYTERGAYLDGLDEAASRRTGTPGQLDRLAAALEEAA